MIKLCVFDFDSTLMDGETITKFAEICGASDKVAQITKNAMAGNLDFFESLHARAKFLKGTKTEQIAKVAQNLPFIKGAKEIIAYLKSKGIKVVVFSGGFHIATDAARDILGFDASFANYLHEKDGVLTGEVGGEMSFGFSKGALLRELKALLGLSADEIMCVGDGANDVSMFKEAGLKIAFCANEVLKKEATYCVETKNLMEIAKYV